jgi:hypothetical protein
VNLAGISTVIWSHSPSEELAMPFRPPRPSIAAASLASRRRSTQRSARACLADFLGVSDNGAVHAYVNHGGDGHGGRVDRGQIAGGVGTPAGLIRI